MDAIRITNENFVQIAATSIRDARESIQAHTAGDLDQPLVQHHENLQRVLRRGRHLRDFLPAAQYEILHAAAHTEVVNIDAILAQQESLIPRVVAVSQSGEQQCVDEL